VREKLGELRRGLPPDGADDYPAKRAEIREWEAKLAALEKTMREEAPCTRI
jgi:hypothetical protein